MLHSKTTYDVNFSSNVFKKWVGQNIKAPTIKGDKLVGKQSNIQTTAWSILPIYKSLTFCLQSVSQRKLLVKVYFGIDSCKIEIIFQERFAFLKNFFLTQRHRHRIYGLSPIRRCDVSVLNIDWILFSLMLRLCSLCLFKLLLWRVLLHDIRHCLASIASLACLYVLFFVSLVSPIPGHASDDVVF